MSRGGWPKEGSDITRWGAYNRHLATSIICPHGEWYGMSADVCSCYGELLVISLDSSQDCLPPFFSDVIVQIARLLSHRIQFESN